MASTSSTPTQSRSFRRGLSMRLNRFRRNFRPRENDDSTQSPQSSAKSVNVVCSANSQPFRPAVDTAATTPIRERSTNRSTVGDIDTNTSPVVCSDLWSAAYREAVESLGNDIDLAILAGSNAAQLFHDLEDLDKDASQDSAFVRGVAYLRSIQVPLERFRLALDLAAPLSNMEPVAATVVGVVRGVTAIAISFASADLELAKQIGEMLEQISYIDDCDTLGQRSSRNDIHKALVPVYQKILEFYQVAHEILTRRGAKLAMKMVLETDRLPNIVQDFLRHADILRKLVEKATWEIVEDIKAMLYDREIARWLNSGNMTLQTRYHSRLQDLRSDEACEFLLAHPNYIAWLCAPDSRLLVILGEMGSGKTVAMGFLVDELRRRNEHQLPQAKICYYYCRDDETGQAVQIFSTLILSLLEQLSGLKKTFYQWYKENQASGLIQPSTNTRKLEEFLDNMLETLDRPLFVVIDGLDECDRESRTTLLKMLRSLSQKTPRLKILLSSRPQEEILDQLQGVPRIDLSSDVQRDALIVRHTVVRQLHYLSDNVRELVIERLSGLAQRSAIWTKMIVELISVRRIRALGPMRLFLDDLPLPGELSTLYAKLLARCSSNDSENEQLAIFALKLLAVSGRPLSIYELSWAVTLAAHPEVTTVAALAEVVDPSRLMDIIHPFVTRVDYSDSRKRQVQLVHQSVREFIMQEWPRLQSRSSSTATQDHETTPRHPESLEPFALNLCIKYLLLDEVGDRPLFSDEQIAIDELPQEYDLFGDSGPFEYDRYCTWEAWEEDMIRYDPTERGFGEFFVYAASQWLKHLAAVNNGSLPPIADIELLCQAGSTRLHNWINQNRRPDCVIKARFEFDSSLYDPLSVAAVYGSDAILHDLLKNATFDTPTYLPSPAMKAADEVLQWGDLSRLKILLESEAFGHQLRNLEFFQLIIQRWVNFRQRHEDWKPAFELIDCVSDALVEDEWGRGLLCAAARAGCLPIIKRLVNQMHGNVKLKHELMASQYIFVEAVLGNNADVVECLLGEADFWPYLLFVGVGDCETVLHVAAKHCNPAVFKLLVPHPRMTKALRQTDNAQETPLMYIIKSDASSKNRYESAKILLAEAVATGPSDKSLGGRRCPLEIAVQMGDVEMCGILICKGRMDPLSVLTCGPEGHLVPKWKLDLNEEEMTRLLRKHAKSNGRA